MDQHIKGIANSINKNKNNKKKTQTPKLNSKKLKIQTINQNNLLSINEPNHNKIMKNNCISFDQKTFIESSTTANQEISNRNKVASKNNKLKIISLSCKSQTKQILDNQQCKSIRGQEKTIHINLKERKVYNKFNQRHKHTNLYMNHLQSKQIAQTNQIGSPSMNNKNSLPNYLVGRPRRSISNNQKNYNFYGVIAQYRRKRLKSNHSLKSYQSAECSTIQQNKLINANNQKKQQKQTQLFVNEQNTLNQQLKISKTNECLFLAAENRIKLFNRPQNRYRIKSLNCNLNSSRAKSVSSNPFEQKVKIMKQHLMERKFSLQKYKKSFDSFNSKLQKNTSKISKKQQLLQNKDNPKNYDACLSIKDKDQKVKFKNKNFSYEQLHLQLNNYKKQLNQYKKLYQSSVKKNKTIQKELQIQKKRNNISKALYKSEIQKIKRKSMNKFNCFDTYSSKCQKHQKQNKINQYQNQGQAIFQADKNKQPINYNCNFKQSNHTQFPQQKQPVNQQNKNFDQLKQKLKNNHLYSYKVYQSFLNPVSLNYKVHNRQLQNENNFQNGKSVLNAQNERKYFGGKNFLKLNQSNDLIVQLSQQLRPSSYLNSSLAKSKGSGLINNSQQNQINKSSITYLYQQIKSQNQSLQIKKSDNTLKQTLNVSNLKRSKLKDQNQCKNNHEVNTSNHLSLSINKIQRLSDQKGQSDQKGYCNNPQIDSNQQSLLLDISSNLNYTITQPGQVQNQKTLQLFSFCQSESLNPYKQQETKSRILQPRYQIYPLKIISNNQFSNIDSNCTIRSNYNKRKQYCVDLMKTKQKINMKNENFHMNKLFKQDLFQQNVYNSSQYQSNDQNHVFLESRYHNNSNSNKFYL